MIPGVSSLFSAFSGFGGSSSGPTSLETQLANKTNPFQANAFAVGAGASATSSPSVNDGTNGSAGGLPPDLLILGAAAAVAVIALVSLRK